MNLFLRRIVFTIVIGSLGAYGYFTLRGPQGIPALMDKRTEIRALEEENATLARENEYRRERIKKLQESSSEQDLEIRRQLKMLHQNETEFIIPNTGKLTTPAP